MIDLHCHILPGIDDGARDYADAVAMARQAEADGIETVCATPHIRHDHDVRIHELADRVGRLEAALAAAGVGVRIATGGEVAETIVKDIDDSELHQVSLGGGGLWILLEPAPGPLADSLNAAVDGLARRGFRCVVAHPERHLTTDLVERLVGLIERGGLVQVTAALLSDADAGPGLVELARHGLVHLLGSDAHSSHAGRPPTLGAAFELLRDVEPVAGHLDWLARAAPAAIVRGEPVRPPFAPRL